MQNAFTERDGTGSTILKQIASFVGGRGNNPGNDEQDEGSPQFVYAPNQNFYGDADREEIEKANAIGFEEFKELMEEYLADRRRKVFT